jgi:hypothetical protein
MKINNTFVEELAEAKSYLVVQKFLKDGYGLQATVGNFTAHRGGELIRVNTIEFYILKDDKRRT